MLLFFVVNPPALGYEQGGNKQFFAQSVERVLIFPVNYVCQGYAAE